MYCTYILVDICPLTHDLPSLLSYTVLYVRILYAKTISNVILNSHHWLRYVVKIS